MPAAVPLGERFWTKADMSAGPDACWTWTANRCRTGYGEIWDRRIRKAHRVAWELTNGPVPDRTLVLHRCDNRPCVNPRHLFLGSYADNVQDMLAKGRQPAHMRPRSTCRKGHPLTPDNLQVGPGHRQCRTCRNDRERRLRAEHRTSTP